MPDLKQTEKNMQAAIDHLRHELTNLRTGRANPTVFENLKIEVYGTQMRMRDVANITCPDARQILITPFDSSNSAAIGKSIEKANLGFTPVVDGNAVRINIPPMDESVRKEMAKQAGKRREEAKISIRNVRRDANEFAKRQKNDGDITEDQQKGNEKKIQVLTDKFCKVADEVAAAKEKEILEV